MVPLRTPEGQIPVGNGPDAHGQGLAAPGWDGNRTVPKAMRLPADKAIQRRFRTNVLEFSHIAAKLGCHKHPTNPRAERFSHPDPVFVDVQGVISPARWEIPGRG